MAPEWTRALYALNVPFVHEFSCDIDKHVKPQILENWPPKVFYDDCCDRQNASTVLSLPDSHVKIPPLNPKFGGGHCKASGSGSKVGGGLPECEEEES